MKRKMVRTVGMLGLSVVLATGVAGCSGSEQRGPDVADSQKLNVPADAGEGSSGRAEDGGVTGDSYDVKDAEEENNTESALFEGANLNGRVIEFSDAGFTITPVHTVVYEDGSTSSWESAPGYEKEEDNIYITYEEDAVFEIVYFSMSQQIETGREDGNKSDVKKETTVYIFGSCQDEKSWTADKVLIQRWVD